MLNVKIYLLLKIKNGEKTFFGENALIGLDYYNMVTHTLRVIFI